MLAVPARCACSLCLLAVRARIVCAFNEGAPACGLPRTNAPPRIDADGQPIALALTAPAGRRA